MHPRFPLTDVKITLVRETRKVEKPEYADNFWQMNQNEFAMQVEGVGSFFACNGNEVEYSPLPSASAESIELYLNGSVYGAILHQRQILPLHGSSFIYDDKGINICGESGAGKSAIVAYFCLNGSEFLTDDVTPVIIENEKPFILPLSDRIKLWNNTLEQLDLDKKDLKQIDSETDKFYYQIKRSQRKRVSPAIVFILEIHESQDIEFREVTGAEKFMALRNEIYRWEYLQGMKENEKVYFKQIIAVSNKVKVFHVKRPVKIEIKRFCSEIKDFIARQ